MKEKKIKMRICGQDVDVIFCDPDVWNNEDMGRSDIKKCRILISNELPKSSRDSTILHELFHYITDTNGFEEVSQKEEVISVLANSILAWMRDNKDIILDIIKDE